MSCRRVVLLLCLCFGFTQCLGQSPGLGLTLTESAAVPKSWGSTFKGTIPSQFMGETRKVSVFVPKSYDVARKRYPLVFLTDGAYYFEHAALAARELYLSGHIPECIVVAIETPERTQDMTPPGMSKELAGGEEKADKFLKFITRELRPALESKFRCSRPNVLVGHSHGGILCHYAAANYRKDFPFIVSLDAPVQLENEWLVKNLTQSIPKGGYLRLVSLEVKYGWRDKVWKKFVSEAPKSWKLVRAPLPKENHESMFFAGCYQGLKDVFADYSRVVTAPLTSRQALTHYSGLAKEYGDPPVPPLNVLRSALDDLTIIGAGEAAHNALKSIVDNYGKPSDFEELNRSIDEAAMMMKGKESIDKILSTPRPAESVIKPYLGIWNGVIGMDGEGDRARLSLTIRNGKAEGLLETFISDDQTLRERLEYLRVTPAGLEFGFMNGMNPRGVLVYAGSLKNGKLAGKMEMRGIYFKYSDGVKPPDITFSFSRH